MTDNAAQFIGNIPLHYDQGLGPAIFVDYAAEMARRVAALAPSRVLETAAGTGIVTRALRDALPAHASLTATDLNAPMLEVARPKFGADETVEFQPADAMALPFADASFDAVVCQFGAMFFPDKDRAYREAIRVLEPGGTYLFSVWDSHRYNPFARIVHAVVGAFFPDDPPQFMQVPFSYPFEPIKDSLLDAGFGDIVASVVCLRKTIPDIATFARGLVYGSPLIDQVRARGGIEAEVVFDTLVRDLRAAFGPEPCTMPLQAIVFSAGKP